MTVLALTQIPHGINDVMAMGIEHGPRVGDLLETVEAWWEDVDYRASREQCLEYLKELIVVSPPA